MVTSEIAELIVRAGALLTRAQDLANAFRPLHDDQVSIVVIAVTGAHAQLRQMLAGESDIRPSAISEYLNAQSAKLDALEGRLHRYNSEAGRPEH